MKYVILEPIKERIGLREATMNIIRPYISLDDYIEVWFLKDGLDQIETTYDDTITAPLVVDRVLEAERSGFDGILINCFNDPGYEAAVEKAKRIIVVGAGIASYLMAMMLGDTFSIITVGGRESIKAIRKRLALYGFLNKLASIYTLNIHVVDIYKASDKIIDEFIKLSLKAYNEDGADVIIMGCTGLSYLSKEIKSRLNRSIKLIDPTIAGFIVLKQACIYNSRFLT